MPGDGQLHMPEVWGLPARLCPDPKTLLSNSLTPLHQLPEEEPGEQKGRRLVRDAASSPCCAPHSHVPRCPDISWQPRTRRASSPDCPATSQVLPSREPHCPSEEPIQLQLTPTTTDFRAKPHADLPGYQREISQMYKQIKHASVPANLCSLPRGGQHFMHIWELSERSLFR